MIVRDLLKNTYHVLHLEKPYAFFRLLFQPTGFIRNYILFPIGGFFRLCGLCSDKDKRLLELKDKYKGQRAFVVCTGPSLTESDILLIKDEFTISMNSIFKMYEKVNWKSSIYMFLEVAGFDKYMNHFHLDLKEMATENSIINSLRSEYATDSRIIPLHYCWLDHYYFYGSNHFKYNPDLFYGMYDYYSTGHAAIILAIYMGFKDIYIIGADNNYNGDKMHFAKSNVPGVLDSYSTEKEKMGIGLKMQQVMNMGYEEIARIGKQMGVNIYNATRGGCVEAFPRVKLEDVVKKGFASK